ncbi:polysaccharide biosynthesis/export family protein [Mucilaginibacter sp.]|uniref:polysaccharide biosynthesis/export family protein n=1 Tax=Mucilaginibacter sp. TaxID=1882438 RepID=UPI00283E7134|nr:polysaccharide biosynthesis/export family protein [Mucilaginibacter sp.]MDR3695441.1 polysaccharide biosynthesis/export family protein [Mucilaginibacter sp.]
MSPKPEAAAYQYHIKSQDILEIRNLQNSKNIVDLNPSQGAISSQGGANNQSETYQVEEDGTVALTGLGHIAVAGLTRYEAQKKIEDLYQKTFLKQPIIALKIVNLKVTILGEIRGQGNYALLKDKTSLVELIGEAGGLTEKADEKNIKIIRGTEQNPHVTEINLNDIGAINNPAALLQSGDIIYVSQNNRARRADNLQNFSTLIQPALILFNTALIIFALVRK